VAAVLEELLDGIWHRARLPQAAEDLPELGEAAHCHRTMDRAAQRAADEGGDGGRNAGDRVVRSWTFRHDEAAGIQAWQMRVPARAAPKLAHLLVFLAAH